MSGLRMVLKRIDRDWYEFKAMTDDELRAEYERLLTREPTSDRFRRMCHFISSRWVYAPNITINKDNSRVGR